jgi:hypothetical protein
MKNFGFLYRVEKFPCRRGCALDQGGGREDDPCPQAGLSALTSKPSQNSSSTDKIILPAVAGHSATTVESAIC